MRKNVSVMGAMEPLFQKIGSLKRLHRILICVATVVVLIAAFGFLLYMPKIDRIADLRSDIADTEDRLASLKKSAQEYDEYQQKMEDARVQFEQIARQLPITEEIPSLLTNISQAGRSSGLTFLLFRPQSEDKKDFYAEIPIQMELSGTYHQLGNFFDRLARLSRIVNIKNCSTQKQDESLKIDCTAITYRFIGE